MEQWGQCDRRWEVWGVGRWAEEAKFGRLKELAPGGLEGGCWRPVPSGYRCRVKEVWSSSYCVPDAVICFASFS